MNKVKQIKLSLTMVFILIFVQLLVPVKSVLAYGIADYRDRTKGWYNFDSRPVSDFQITNYDKFTGESTQTARTETSNAGNEEYTRDGPPLNPAQIIHSRVGDTIQLLDYSRSKYGSNPIVAWDLQIYGGGIDHQGYIFTPIDGYMWQLNETGVIDIYLNVGECNDGTGDVTNWSDNGTHQSTGPAMNEWDGVEWYFTHIRVIVTARDFIINDDEGTNYTDKEKTVQLTQSDSYGVTYNVSLNFDDENMTNVEKLDWINKDTGEVVTVTDPYQYFFAKGSETGYKNTYGMALYYWDGTRYPLTPGSYIEHNITIKETKDDIPPPASGQIKFDPNTSFDISGNREGWVNADIPVKVTVTGDKTIQKNGSRTRGYEWYEPCTPTPDGCFGGGMRSGSSSSSTKEYYKIHSLTVWGEGKDASGNTVNLPKRTDVADGGTYTITQELKNIQLHAEITAWDFDYSVWGSSSPPQGSWTDYGSPGQNTSNPTDKYTSQSELYYLDKTLPTHTTLSPANSNNLNPQGNGTGWTNQVITVPIQIKDNLSGFWTATTYFEVKDNSYLHQATIKQSYTKGSLDQTKNAVIQKDGIYQIDVHAEDIAKNQMSTTTYQEYKYDKTNPYSAQFTRDYRAYIDEDITVTVTVGDNLSGVYETKWVLNNSPTDTSGMTQNSVQTPDRQSAYNTFPVLISQPGSWWIHTYVRDRAGNETWTTSSEYKIIRLGNSNNRIGQNFSGLSNQIWLEPRQTNDKIPRATRFDNLMEVYGQTSSEAQASTVTMTLPKWVDDSITKKVNGLYAVTSGTVQHTMNYYSGHDVGPQGIATPATIVQFWKAFIPPYGTPLTMDRNLNRLAPQTSISMQLTYPRYNPSNTHVSTIYYDIVPETKIKTEIINNQY